VQTFSHLAYYAAKRTPVGWRTIKSDHLIELREGQTYYARKVEIGRFVPSESEMDLHEGHACVRIGDYIFAIFDVLCVIPIDETNSRIEFRNGRQIDLPISSDQFWKVIGDSIAAQSSVDGNRKNGVPVESVVEPAKPKPNRALADLGSSDLQGDSDD
jgi:hypothetical protein